MEGGLGALVIKRNTALVGIVLILLRRFGTKEPVEGYHHKGDSQHNRKEQEQSDVIHLSHLLKRISAEGLISPHRADGTTARRTVSTVRRAREAVSR